MSDTKFNVHPIKLWCDGKRKTEGIDQMVLKLQQTFVIGAELHVPENDKIRLQELTVKEKRRPVKLIIPNVKG